MPARSLPACVTLILLPLIAFSTVACSKPETRSSAALAVNTTNEQTLQISSEQQAQSYNLMELGRQKYEQGDSQKALELLDAAIRVDPNSYNVYYNRGTVLLELSRYELSIADFSQALKLNPQWGSAYLNRGNAWSEVGEFSKAVADYQTAIRLNPNNGSAYLNLGLAYRDLKAYPESLAAYDQGLKVAPNNPRLYYSQALTRTDMKQRTEALADYDQAIRLEPNYLAAYINRGRLKQTLEDLPGSLADFNRAIELQPQFSLSYGNRAYTHVLLRDYKAALYDYNAAIQLGSDNLSGVYRVRGLVHSRLGDTAAAIADTRKAMEIAQQLQDQKSRNMYVLAERQLAQLESGSEITIDSDSWYNDFREQYVRATDKIHRGESQAAIEDFNYLVAAQPNDPGTYNNRGIAYSRKGRHREAAADFTKVIELKPEDGRTYFNRGIEYLMMGDRASALRDFQTSAQLLEKQGDTAALQRVQAQLNSMK
jgi:tetratricopeptide (TPR) repeat protein